MNAPQWGIMIQRLYPEEMIVSSVDKDRYVNIRRVKQLEHWSLRWGYAVVRLNPL